MHSKINIEKRVSEEFYKFHLRLKGLKGETDEDRIMAKEFCYDSNPKEAELYLLLEGVLTVLNSVVEDINILNSEFPSQSPEDSWTIVQIKSWLDQENIDYTGVTIKSELLALTSDE